MRAVIPTEDPRRLRAEVEGPRHDFNPIPF